MLVVCVREGGHCGAEQRQSFAASGWAGATRMGLRLSSLVATSRYVYSGLLDGVLYTSARFANDRRTAASPNRQLYTTIGCSYLPPRAAQPQPSRPAEKREGQPAAPQLTISSATRLK
jgi:hypothetical protein